MKALLLALGTLALFAHEPSASVRAALALLPGSPADLNEGGPPGRFAPSDPMHAWHPLVLPHVVAGQSPVTTSDIHESKAVLLGETTAKAILAHRAVFRDNLAKVKLTPALRARWKAVRRPLTLVAVFGSWCGDSHRQLPGLLALEAEPNPCFAVHYVGVNHDKAVPGGAWPKGCAPQQAVRVPTFFLFALQPGGAQRLVGSVVETPPRKDQTMAEALVELVESAGKASAH